VFNAQEPAGSTSPLRFNPTGTCPAYQVAPEIAQEVAAKTKNDELAFAELVRKGTPTAPVKTGQDGGMHPTFVAALNPQQVRDDQGNVRWAVESPPIGSHIPSIAARTSDPRLSAPVAETTTVATAALPASVPMPRPAPHRRAVASAPSSKPVAAYASTGSTGRTEAPAQSDGMFNGILTAPKRAASSVARVFGFGDEEPKPVAKAAAPVRRAPPARVAHRRPAAKHAPKSEAQQTAEATPPARKPVESSEPAKPTAVMSGAQPVVPAGGFENRWPSSFR
jgi:hypothetical protein